MPNKTIIWSDLQKAIEEKSENNESDALEKFLLKEYLGKYKKIKGPPRELKYYYLGDLFPSVYLTKREAEVMFFVMEGFTNDEAAEALALSKRTIEFYVKIIREKVDAHSKSQLISIMRRTQFYRPEHIDTDVELIKRALDICQRKKLKKQKP